MFLVARTESKEPNKRVIMCQILKTESLYILIFVRDHPFKTSVIFRERRGQKLVKFADGGG